mgnify:CR=1 FL=1
MVLNTSVLAAVNTVCGMQIDSPASEGDRIRVMSLFDDILLNQRIFTFKTAAFALTRNRSDPRQGKILRIGKIPRILDIIPHTVDDAPNFPLDLFRIVYRIEPSPLFEPPKTTTVFGGADFPPTRNAGDVL